MRKNTKTPEIVLYLSDTHCGSDVGLMPKQMYLEDGQEIGYGKNKWQEWLWNSFQKTQETLLTKVGNDPFILVFGGDLIEGCHHRSDETVAAKIMEHLTIAKAALGPLIEKAHTSYFVRGTDCHVRDLETVVAKEFGAGKAHDFIQFEVNGVLCDARHHMPTTTRLHLEATALGVIVANNRSNAVRAGHKPARVFLRGHRHLAGTYSDGECLVACTGAFQGLTRFGKKVVTDAIPRPSMLLLDWRGLPKGHLPAVLHPVCNPPQELVAHCIP